MTSDTSISSASLENQVAAVVARVDMLVGEMRDFKNETREQNKMRADENSEIRNDIKEIYKTTDAKISKIESKIDSMASHIQILAVTAVGGLIAAGVGIAAMVISTLTKT